MNDINFVEMAIEKASQSVYEGGFPAGAVVVKDGKVVGEGISVGNKLNDPTSHGEVCAIRNACMNLQTTNLSDTVLYTSMEPCSMCHSAAMWSGISKIVYACSKDKVSIDYYGGTYKTDTLNNSLIKPIEIVKLIECEESSLKLIREWEAVFINDGERDDEEKNKDN